MKARLYAFLTLSFVAISMARAEGDKPYIAVGKAKTQKTVFAFPQIKKLGTSKALDPLIKTIHEVIKNDLLFMDLFKLLDQAAYLEKSQTAGLTPDQFKYADWTTIQTQILLKTGIQLDGNRVTLETYLYDVSKGEQLLAKKFIANTDEVRTLAHSIANEIVTKLTGLPGVFLTKIVMSCDRTGKKEIYVMNIDGTDVKQITSHRSNAFAPAWSPDSKKIAYSLYVRHHRENSEGQKIVTKNMDLYEFDFATRELRLLSNREGINSGANYNPDGKSVAMTMSFLGNPEIFSLDRQSRQATRLTKSFGFDVDPAWSPKGTQMAFVSSRTGRPMVHLMDADGKNEKRLTFAGRYNASPTWSPQNNKIAFAGWLDNRFDIFTMNPDGTKIDRLTKGQGSNEDPHFSPDGNFITFSSDRTGKRNVYVMNVDGSFVKRITYGLGNCMAPKWSNPP